MNSLRSLGVVLILLQTAPAWSDELKTITGKSITGKLQKITSNSIVVLDAANVEINTPLSQVLDVMLQPGRTAPTAAKYIEIQLADNSILRCNKVTFRAN